MASSADFAQRYGPWALVAGASEGLGAAFARELHARGLSLILLARRSAPLETLADELRAEGATPRVLAMDLASPDAHTQLLALARELEIGLGIYNAAYAPVGDIAERSFEELMRVVDVNVRGPLTLTHALLPPLRERGRGGLLLMSSLAGFQGTPRLATYAASKAFNTILAEGLWGELRAQGIDVLASCAGAIRTPGYDAAAGKQAPGTLDAASVARRSLDALARGPRVVPGALNKVASLLVGRWLPRRRAVAIMAANTRELENSAR